jgi:hypothetical protein
MTSRLLSQIISVLFLIFTVNVVGALEFAPEDKATIYGGLIDEVIKKYEVKACLSNSTCEAIQKDVAFACMKAAYYKAFKQEFIKQMCEQNLDPKPHKVKHFLNQRFFDVVRSANGRQTYLVKSN